MADLFTLNPAAKLGDLIDELNGRLSAGVEAILEHDTSLTQSQWAGIHSLQQCVQIAEALGRARSDAATAGEAAPAAAITSPAGAHPTVVREALSAASDFMDAIIYLADGALSKGPDFESLAYLEGIKALAEKTAAAIEPAAQAIATQAGASADAIPTPELAARADDAAAADIPGPVARLAREATYEIAALTQALAEHYGQVTGEDQRPLVVRGMALRAHQLNMQLMSILDSPKLHARPADLRSLSWAVLGEHSAEVEDQA